MQFQDREQLLSGIEKLFDMVPLFALLREITSDVSVRHTYMPVEEVEQTMKIFKTCALRQTGSFLLQIGQLVRNLDDYKDNKLIGLLIANDSKYLVQAMQPIKDMISGFVVDSSDNAVATELGNKISVLRHMAEDKLSDLVSHKM